MPAEQMYLDFWIGNPNDPVIGIPNPDSATPFSAASAYALCTAHPTIFSLVQNGNGQLDLIQIVPTSETTEVTGSFRQYGVTPNQDYTVKSQFAGYIGGQPQPPIRK